MIIVFLFLAVYGTIRNLEQENIISHWQHEAARHLLAAKEYERVAILSGAPCMTATDRAEGTCDLEVGFKK